MTWRELKNQLSHFTPDQLNKQITIHGISDGYHNVPDRVKKARANLYTYHDEAGALFTKTQGIRERGIWPEQFEDWNEGNGPDLMIKKGDWVLEID